MISLARSRVSVIMRRLRGRLARQTAGEEGVNAATGRAVRTTSPRRRIAANIKLAGDCLCQTRTSLRSSWSPFPGKSDFGAQRPNGHNVRGSRVRENSETKLTRWKVPIRGYLAPPREFSAVGRLIGGAMRTRTKDPLSGYAGAARRIRGAEQIVHLCLGRVTAEQRPP
jgi:hypothetical protein